MGAILTVGRIPTARSVDKTIASYAPRSDGFYQPQVHDQIARMTGGIPGGDVEGHIEGHVRRLEALRMAGIVNRLDDSHWLIPADFLERAAAYDDRQGQKLVVDLHSAVELSVRSPPTPPPGSIVYWSADIMLKPRPWDLGIRSKRRWSNASST